MKVAETRIVNLKPLQREIVFEDDKSVFIEGHNIVEVYDMDGLMDVSDNRLNEIRNRLNVKFIEWNEGVKTVS